MLHTKMEGKRPGGRSRIIWIYQIRKDIKIRGENLEEIKKTGSRRTETTGDFSVIIDS